MKKWVGEDLVNLVTKGIDELARLYPDQSIENLKRRKREKRAVMEKFAANPEDKRPEYEALSRAFGEQGISLSPEDLSMATRAGFHVGFIRNQDGEIEYTKPLPHVEFGKPKSELTVEPVEAAVIHPIEALPIERDYKVIFVFSDAQIGYRRLEDELMPLHDEAAIRASQMLVADLQPDVLVDNGDTTDFAELSRHPVDSDHFQGTLQPSLQRTHNMLAEFTAVSPNAYRITVGSNHIKRLTDYTLRNAFPLYNIKAADEKYAALSYPGLLKLDHIGWDFAGGYDGAEYQYNDDLAFIHGTFAVSAGSTASKLSRANPDRNIVQGHVHRMESQYHTDRRGRVFGAYTVGALCRIDGTVPSYHSSIDQFNQPVKHYENWQQGVMVIYDYGDGVYQFDHVTIRDGVIHYQGKEYNGKSSE